MTGWVDERTKGSQWPGLIDFLNVHARYYRYRYDSLGGLAVEHTELADMMLKENFASMKVFLLPSVANCRPWLHFCKHLTPAHTAAL
jgi:hypothetical protein